jgi:pimeloyl-ACP methyl ester carboxylesterase
VGSVLTKLATALALCVSFAGCASSSGGTAQLSVETFMIPAFDPGIQLHVRNKHPSGSISFSADRILLMVHGATFPSEAGFDLDLPGGSWLEHAARGGFDAYLIDVRGYGRSTRPEAMSLPPADSPPFADTREAMRDVAAAVDFILRRRSASSLNLLGWSWGAGVMAAYAAENPARVAKLVLYGPVWMPDAAPGSRGSYRTVTREGARSASTVGIPPERLEQISPSLWYEQWWTLNLALDPIGASKNPAVVRAPNGIAKDFSTFWSVGQPPYDPQAIRASTLLVVGEWDRITPPTMAEEIFRRLSAAKQRRFVLLSEGSHFMLIETNRMHLIREVQSFLEEPSQ